MIQAVESRRHHVEKLLAAIPEARVTWSLGEGPRGMEGKEDANKTFYRCLLAAGRDGYIHMEDDVIPCVDWRAKVEAVIEARPFDVVQFFSRRGKDLTVGSRWEPGASFTCTVSMYLPPGIPALLAGFYPRYLATRPPRGTNSKGMAGTAWMDQIIQDWLRSTGRRYWLHAPSLVQHAELKSVLGHFVGPRLSASFRDPDPRFI